MKKKLLSLVLAGAMVASTSVSAFAETKTHVVRENDGQVNVDINGVVDANDGTSPSGTISVSVPTALNFKVDKTGRVEGSSINITNNGAEAVDIIAVNFEDTTPTLGITVKAPNELNQQQLNEVRRNEVALSIRGTGGTGVYLKTVNAGVDETGLVDASGTKQTNFKLSTIEGNGNSDSLTLSGFAGTKILDGEAADKGITDKFVLTLKISKASR